MIAQLVTGINMIVGSIVISHTQCFIEALFKNIPEADRFKQEVVLIRVRIVLDRLGVILCSRQGVIRLARKVALDDTQMPTLAQDHLQIILIVDDEAAVQAS